MEPLTDILEAEISYLSAEDQGRVMAALRLAEGAHRGQLRKSGDAYISHPLAVTSILAELHLDAITIQAALLHDAVEDTSLTLDEIRATCGEQVAALVDGVTTLTQLEDRSRVEAAAENLRKMFLAMAQDVRVMMVKLADRLHNMRTLSALSPLRQKAIAKETLEIFAPLAHRLGMSRLKWELEDLSLRYLDPVGYREIANMVAETRDEREARIQAVTETLRQELAAHGMKAEIQGRPKSFYSIYQKLQREGDFSRIYDLIAVRVLVETVHDCYVVLGIVHNLFKPLPGRFKDYITLPKSNLYQSLHTTVLGPRGRPFEVQIRTFDMHRTAEFGIAAHWIYKEGHADPTFDQKLAWLRQALENQGDMKEPGEFFETLRGDLFSDEVFVFTPKGMVVDLPRGATPVDFAYRIHTDVGHRCIGARASGRIVPLDYRLKNGDIIEIITSKSPRGPSQDWLSFVRTSTARNRIRQWFKAKNREENVRLGRDLLEREARRLGLEPDDLLRQEWLQEVSERFHYQSADDLLAAIGYGGFSVGQTLSKLREKLSVPVLPGEAPSAETGFGRPSEGVRVRGADNILAKLAGCCSPVPGDPIVGYITRGKGVSVHRTDCPNMIALAAESERLVEVAWDRGARDTYSVEIEVRALDRSGLLADVASIVATTKVNIVSAKARGYRNQTAAVTVVLEIHNLGELSHIMEQLHALPEVLSVERVSHRKAN